MRCCGRGWMQWWMGAWLTLGSLLLLVLMTLVSVLVWYVRRVHGKPTEGDPRSALSRARLGEPHRVDADAREGEDIGP